jgi:predicted SnoaL-like aldol condensation-catalyzing enzyme
MTDRLERNKATAMAFYDLMFNKGRPAEAVKLYVGATYIQHNPHVGDGAAPFVAYFEKAAAEHPDKHITFTHAVAEGDLVALHSHQHWPRRDQKDWAVVDIFRFDETGKIVEHWDVLQAVPPTSANANTMF